MENFFNGLIATIVVIAQNIIALIQFILAIVIIASLFTGRFEQFVFCVILDIILGIFNLGLSTFLRALAE